MSAMKALTLKRPWAFAIIHGKCCENRSKKPPKAMVGERFAIHAGQNLDSNEAADFVQKTLGLRRLPPESLHEGIVCTAKLVGVIEAGPGIMSSKLNLIAGTVGNLVADRVRPWFFGPYGYLLDEVRPLRQPIPWKGALGFWRVPAEIEAEIARLELTS